MDKVPVLASSDFGIDAPLKMLCDGRWVRGAIAADVPAAPHPIVVAKIFGDIDPPRHVDDAGIGALREQVILLLTCL